MEKTAKNFSTEVKLTSDEAKSICKLGQGNKCCAFLVMSPSGFECVRMRYPTSETIFGYLKKGTINAKGEGGWENCAWEEKNEVS